MYLGLDAEGQSNRPFRSNDDPTTTTTHRSRYVSIGLSVCQLAQLFRVPMKIEPSFSAAYAAK